MICEIKAKDISGVHKIQGLKLGGLAVWQMCSTARKEVPLCGGDMHLGRSLLGSDMNTFRHGGGVACTVLEAKTKGVPGGSG